VTQSVITMPPPNQSSKSTCSGKGWKVDVMRRLLAKQEKRKPNKASGDPIGCRLNA